MRAAAGVIGDGQRTGSATFRRRSKRDAESAASGGSDSVAAGVGLREVSRYRDACDGQRAIACIAQGDAFSM